MDEHYNYTMLKKIKTVPSSFQGSKSQIDYCNWLIDDSEKHKILIMLRCIISSCSYLLSRICKMLHIVYSMHKGFTL